MASLDQILDRMRERGAERLDLRIGQVPVVRASGRAVLVQKVPLTEEQVLALAEEMASGDALTRLTRREPVDFIYRGFHVNVTFAPPGIAVVVTPGPGPTHPAPEPIPPLDVVSGLQTANAAETDSPISAPPDSIELDIAPGTGPQASRAPSPVAVGVRAPSIAPSPRPAAPVAAPLPGGFIDDIRSWFETRRARYIGLGAAGALLLLVTGGVLWCNRPVRVPNVVMADASGHAVTFDDMRGARPRLLVVFLLPGCSMSKFAADTLKAAYPDRSERTAFVGLFSGTQQQAVDFAKSIALPFPVYGLRDSMDPFLLQELMNKVGTSDWLVHGIYGGTTFALDDRNRILFKLEKEDVRKLPEKLCSLD